MIEFGVNDEPRAVFICDGCGGTIYEGYDAYHIQNEVYCETCIEEKREVAVYDPY